MDAPTPVSELAPEILPDVTSPVPVSVPGPLRAHLAGLGALARFGGLVLIAYSLFFNLSVVRGSSMTPGIQDGDRILVEPWSYLLGPIERGDVVVLRYPLDPEVDYIKRIIGLPGDRIQVKGGVLHINGQPVRRERIADFIDTESGRPQRVTQYVETLPSGRKHRIIEVTDNGSLDDTPVFVVPPGHYFAMGDNRDNSLDSRVQGAVGFVPAENLVGRAEFLFFSNDGTARFWEVWKWPGAIRWDRLFTAIE